MTDFTFWISLITLTPIDLQPSMGSSKKFGISPEQAKDFFDTRDFRIVTLINAVSCKEKYFIGVNRRFFGRRSFNQHMGKYFFFSCIFTASRSLRMTGK